MGFGLRHRRSGWHHFRVCVRHIFLERRHVGDLPGQVRAGPGDFAMGLRHIGAGCRHDAAMAGADAIFILGFRRPSATLCVLKIYD